jgi:hypothetical protein
MRLNIWLLLAGGALEVEAVVRVGIGRQQALL